MAGNLRSDPHGRIASLCASDTRVSGRTHAGSAFSAFKELKVEAFGIAVVSCLLMVRSIHRLLASSGRASQAPEILETHDADSLPSSVPKVLTSSQQNAAARESSGDLVIHYRAPTAATRTTSKSGARIAVSRQENLAANRVVQYGNDVTMWSSGELSPGQSARKSFCNR